MNRTWKENFTAKMKLRINKHKFMKYPMMVWLSMVTTFYDIGHYFMYNSKRLMCVMTVLIFFVMGSSFSFVGEATDIDMMSESMWAEIQENYEYLPTVFDDEDETIPSDDDLMEGYDEHDEQIDETDQYSLDDILAANEYNSQSSENENDETVDSVSKDDWQLILVNKQHPIPDDYEFTSGIIKGSMKCDVRILGDLSDMMKAAKADGINLVVSSSYRDYNRQTFLFNRKIDYYMKKGYSYLEAYKLASITVTVPDASEHQIGLALDIASTTYSSLEIGFGDTKAGKWLAAHCAEYGFILRYPLGKEDVTGIQYEPWHFRYVGKTAATEIMERGITLEEFVAELD